jgi:hypothetical protein
MAMTITPHVGVGDVYFGMSQTEVERVRGAPSRKFFRNQFSVGPEWQYQGEGIIVSFDATGHCDALQLAAPCDPVLRGVHLLSMGAPAAMAALRRLDPGVTRKDDALVSASLGVSIFAPEADDHPEWPASGVLVFRPDYYGSPGR